MSLSASEVLASTNTTSPKTKRRKIQQACHPCRVRKTGCDGCQPCCTPCRMRGWQERCSYPGTRPDSSALTLVDLDRRLQRLEGSAGAPWPTPENSVTSRDISKDGQETPAHDKATHDTSAKPPSPIRDHEPALGLTSNFSFVQQVSSVVDPGHEESDDIGPGRVVSTAIGYPVSLPTTNDYNLKDLVLPPRHLADSIMRCYWELFNSVFPVLHQPSFNDAYSLIWQPAKTTTAPDILFYSTLNIALALGCHRNEAFAEIEREELADEFYKRSLKLVSIETIDESSLQVVQLLLLRGFYLLYTPYANRCWSTVGAALRFIQAVGLRSTKKTVSSNQLEREMCRRVWHCCAMLDWMTSMSFSRPSGMLREHLVPVPEVIDDEHLLETGEGQQPEGIPSRLSFFVYALKLLDIREKFEAQRLETGRKPYSGEELGYTLDQVSSLDRLLESLPAHLKRDRHSAHPTSDHETCFMLQGSVLEARVMYARLRMTRPLILFEARRAMESSDNQSILTSTPNLQNKLYRELCALSVSTAHKALEELHCQLSSIYRNSPWHNLYFTFAASSILVAATLFPYLDVQLDQGPGKTSWDRALQIFEFHKAHVASAGKGIEALEKFRRFIKRQGIADQGESELGSVLALRNRANDESVAATRSQDSSVDGAAPVRQVSLESPVGLSWNSSDPIFWGNNELASLWPIDQSWLASQDFDFQYIALP